MIPLAVAENACWQEVFKLAKPSDYLLVPLESVKYVNGEWSLSKGKNELNTVMGTVPVSVSRGSYLSSGSHV